MKYKSPPPRTQSAPANGRHGYAASYARKSDKNDWSVEKQHELLTSRARDDGWVVPDDEAYRFEDDNTTGVTTSRRGLDRLLALIESGDAPFTRLYIRDKTRFGRFDDPRYHHYLEVHLERHGVTVCYWEKEEPQANLANPDNPNRHGAYLQDAMGSILASEERRRLIERVTAGMRDRVRGGFYPGSRPPYGTVRWLADKYTGTLIEPVPAHLRLRRVGCFFRLAWADDGTRDVIRRVFRLLEEGRSLRSIASELNRAGIPSPGARGSGRRPSTWGPESIRRLAANSIYCGDLVWGRTTRVDAGPPLAASESRADGDPAILYVDFVVGDPPVSRAQWAAVQGILAGSVAAARGRRASRPEYLLSGLVQCAHCKRPFHGHSPHVSGGVRYYRHDWRKPPEGGPCPHANRYVPASPLEEAASTVLRSALADGGLASAVREEITRRREALKAGKQAEHVRDLESQLGRHRTALNAATRDKAYAASEAERASCAATISHISDEVLRYERLIEEAEREQESLARVEARLARLNTWTPERLERALTAAPAERKRVLCMLIDSIAISPERRDAEVRIRPPA